MSLSYSLAGDALTRDVDFSSWNSLGSHESLNLADHSHHELEATQDIGSKCSSTRHAAAAHRILLEVERSTRDRKRYYSSAVQMVTAVR